MEIDGVEWALLYRVREGSVIKCLLNRVLQEVKD